MSSYAIQTEHVLMTGHDQLLVMHSAGANQSKTVTKELTSSMQRVLSMWKRWKNGPTRWQTKRNCSSVFTTGFSLSLMKLQDKKNLTTES